VERVKKTTVFLDWINTLVRMEPDRHEMGVAALREVGVEIDPQLALKGILAAEQQLPAGRPVQWTEDDDPAIYATYNDIMMRTAGLAPLDRETTMTVVRRVREMAKSIRFKLFDDVVPSLSELKRLGLTTAVLSNMNRPLQPALEKLGLTGVIDFSLTSSEVGGPGKPDKPIFLEALQRASAAPSQAVHVGDEPWVDGAGAEGVGITPVIIDRLGLSASESGYRRITSLSQLPALIETLA
jgi:HAD superfamily hydrolase (TIGR01549 family)